MGQHNFSEKVIAELFRREPIDIWINSFGGCRSNFVRDCIKNKYTTYNSSYEMKACHYIRPLDVKVGSGIFCYTEDVGIALSSQIKRDMYHNFQKLMEGSKEVPFSIETWLNNISIQIDNWTAPSYFPIVIINTDKLEENLDLFEEVYGVKFGEFKQRSTVEYDSSLTPYLSLVKEINQKLKNLPNFAVNE